jgi:hypothetical protein
MGKLARARKYDQTGKPKPRVDWKNDPNLEVIYHAMQAGIGLNWVMEKTGLSINQISYRQRKICDAEGLSVGETFRLQWRKGEGEQVQAYTETIQPHHVQYYRSEVARKLLTRHPR